ncbi:MAG: O-antigen ligase family protein [Calditrichaeota bacterium]|nr:O-antigen ligase family protein [Calditrichota bacterium]
MRPETQNKLVEKTELITPEAPPFFRFLANFSFAVFMFFTFFNTQMPFQQRVYDVASIGTTNIVNQIVYTLLFFTAFISLLPKKEGIVLFIQREIFLTLFLIWCTLSIFWSDYSFIAFKRLFQFYTMGLIFLAVFLYNGTVEKLLIYFKIILSAFLLISFVSVFTVPGAIDPSAGTWRGLALSKNLLGQNASIAIIFWFNMMKRGSFLSKSFSFFMLIISIVLLIGSMSMTSIMVLLMIVSLAILFSFEKALFYRLGVKNTYSILLIASAIIVLGTTYVAAPEIVAALPQTVGKDATFTGRTDLWKDIYREAQSHFFIGCGFKSFWGISNPNLFYLYQKYIWLPNQAHNGFLDMFNELGAIGILLFFLVIVFYFKNITLLNRSHFWRWLFVAGLIINLQETTFFSVKHPSGVLLIFAYFALYAELLKQEANSSAVSQQAKI